MTLSGLMNDRTDSRAKTGQDEVPPGGKLLPPAAERALAEAAERRKEYDRRQAEAAKELGGRGGKDPGRYGDWEVKGIASDF
jgi:hypothetical protein